MGDSQSEEQPVIESPPLRLSVCVLTRPQPGIDQRPKTLKRKPAGAQPDSFEEDGENEDPDAVTDPDNIADILASDTLHRTKKTTTRGVIPKMRGVLLSYIKDGLLILLKID